jgi:hypothetical protein
MTVELVVRMPACLHRLACRACPSKTTSKIPTTYLAPEYPLALFVFFDISISVRLLQRKYLANIIKKIYFPNDHESNICT